MATSTTTENPEARHLRVSAEQEVRVGTAGGVELVALVGAREMRIAGPARCQNCREGECDLRPIGGTWWCPSCEPYARSGGEEAFHPYRVLLNVPSPGLLLVTGVRVGTRDMLREPEDAYNFFLHEVQRQELEWHLRGRARHDRLALPVLHRGDTVRVSGELTSLVPRGDFEKGQPFVLCAHVDGTDRR